MWPRRTLIAPLYSKWWNVFKTRNWLISFQTIFLGREGETILHSARIQVKISLWFISSVGLTIAGSPQGVFICTATSFTLTFHPIGTMAEKGGIFTWWSQTIMLFQMIGRNSYPDELIALLVEHFIQPDPALRLVSCIIDYLICFNGMHCNWWILVWLPSSHFVDGSWIRIHLRCSCSSR